MKKPWNPLPETKGQVKFRCFSDISGAGCFPKSGSGSPGFLFPAVTIILNALLFYERRNILIVKISCSRGFAGILEQMNFLLSGRRDSRAMEMRQNAFPYYTKVY